MQSFESKLLGLAEKAAIVTGASGGIGGETVILFARLGTKVVAVGRKFKPQQFSGLPKASVVRVVGDVSDRSTANRAVEECVKAFGRLDILVNNAGMIKGGSVLDLDEADWDRTLAVNLGGYRNFAQAVVSHMVKNKVRGRIVNVSSVDGIMAERGVVAYSASKGAINMLTKTLAIELADKGIRVNSVAPGWVDTPMGTGVLDAHSRKLVEQRIPLGYIAPPSEIAGAIAFLASDLSNYMTGEVMVVDGGLTADISIPGLEY